MLSMKPGRLCDSEQPELLRLRILAFLASFQDGVDASNELSFGRIGWLRPVLVAGHNVTLFAILII